MEMTIWPLREHGLLRREIYRLLGEVQGANGDGNGTNAYGTWVPPLSVCETPETVVVTTEVPGVDKESLDISITGNQLVLKGEKREESDEKGKTWHHIERSYGAFARSVLLPAPVDPTAVEAETKDGVLTVTVQKRAEAMPRKIAIRAS
ncbi:MAG: Hsp20/alpha crystallin family protein [Planctomycetales bacterium]|nr:Hsp20/alpha crystallin family protein [Planctomycetales bacterium]